MTRKKDVENEAPVVGEADADLPRLRVFDGVVDRLLGEEVQVGRRAARSAPG